MKQKIIDFFKFKWFVESNRPYHFAVLFVAGLVASFDAVVGISGAIEMKDWMWNGKKGGIFGWVKGNGFDWIDFAVSVLGGIAGRLVRMAIL